jgi:class 3 adenylate cyclase
MFQGSRSEPGRELGYRSHVLSIATARLRVVCLVLAAVFVLDGGFEFLTQPRAFFANFWVRVAALVGCGVVFLLVRRRVAHPRALLLVGILVMATAIDIEAAVLTTGGQRSTFYAGFLLLMVAAGLLFPFGALGALSFCGVVWVAFFAPLALGHVPIEAKLLADQTFFLACASLVAAVGSEVTARLRKSEFLSREALRDEKALSERLLLNVLPRSIADRLKAGPEAIADRFPDASILFADIVGFTPLSERMPPEEVVALLDEVFSAFDRAAAHRGLEKIKTIGDAYMVAAGLPTPRRDHLEALADMALEMQRVVLALDERRGLDLAVRVGIHAGPVVAGVIGTSKFSYDVWGDTVNTASRMESHGAPGQIQVTDTVRSRLEGGYEFSEPRRIEVKGKGTLTTSFLLGKGHPPAGNTRGRAAA